MRILAVDWGFKRIGIAAAETHPRAITARPAIAAAGALKRDASAIATLARREEADKIVLGLPVEESGEEGRMARICRQLADLLESEGFAVKLVDETLSSVQAEERLLRSDLKASQRRKLRDGEAACLLLERYLDANSQG